MGLWSSDCSAPTLTCLFYDRVESDLTDCAGCEAECPECGKAKPKKAGTASVTCRVEVGEH